MLFYSYEHITSSWSSPKYMPSLSWLYWSFHWSVFNLIVTNLFTTFFTTSHVFLELLHFPYIYMQSLTTTFSKSVSIQHFYLMCTPWRPWQKAPLSGECINFKRGSMHTKTKSSEMVLHYNANRECSRKSFVLAQRNVFLLSTLMHCKSITKCSSKNKMVW